MEQGRSIWVRVGEAGRNPWALSSQCRGTREASPHWDPPLPCPTGGRDGQAESLTCVKEEEAAVSTVLKLQGP